jgi:hypothetical protein
VSTKNETRPALNARVSQALKARGVTCRVTIKNAGAEAWQMGALLTDDAFSALIDTYVVYASEMAAMSA